MCVCICVPQDSILSNLNATINEQLERQFTENVRKSVVWSDKYDYSQVRSCFHVYIRTHTRMFID
jgi:hypothetical protein